MSTTRTPQGDPGQQVVMTEGQRLHDIVDLHDIVQKLNPIMPMIIRPCTRLQLLYRQRHVVFIRVPI